MYIKFSPTELFQKLDTNVMVIYRYLKHGKIREQKLIKELQTSEIKIERKAYE